MSASSDVLIAGIHARCASFVLSSLRRCLRRFERCARLWSHFAIGDEPLLQLEGDNGSLRVWPEDAIDLAWREAGSCESFL